MKKIKKFNESGFLPYKDEEIPKGQIENLQEIMDELKDIINNEIYDLNLKIGELESNISSLKNRISNLDPEIDNLYGEEIDEIYNFIDKLEFTASDAFTYEREIEANLENIIYDIKHREE